MKTITAVMVLIFCQSLQANEIDAQGPFDKKIYTPEVVTDKNNEGPKGAVQLLWQKSNKPTRYEVEVSNGLTTYSSVHEKHFHHVMLFFNKDYRWRVREISQESVTEFSPWMPVKVVKHDHTKSWKRESASAQTDEDEYTLDIGAQNP